MSLATIQRQLAEAFQRPGAVADDAACARACAAHVAGNDWLSPAEQVDIYREQFWFRHIDSLREDHPGLAYVLGEDAFEAFCRAYLAAHPPRTPSLRDLGADVVAFAARYEGFPPAAAALARSMIRYEHAFVDLFDGRDAPPLAPERLASVPEEAWETARVVLSPLLARLRLEHPVHELRLQIREGKRPALPPPREVHVALFRKDLMIRFEELSPTAFALLDALARGVPLIPALGALAEGKGDEAAAELTRDVGTWFRDWAAWGLIVDVIERP